jgi:hypothetical protein
MCKAYSCSPIITKKHIDACKITAAEIVAALIASDQLDPHISYCEAAYTRSSNKKKPVKDAICQTLPVKASVCQTCQSQAR